MHKDVQFWLYIHSSAFPQVAKKSLKSVLERAVYEGGTTTIFRGQPASPLERGHFSSSEGEVVSVSRSGWGWRADTCFTPKVLRVAFLTLLASPQVRNHYPWASSCCWQGQDGSSALLRHPCWRSGLPGKEAAASTVKRGPKMGEAEKFQRVKVMPRACGDTSGYLWRRLGHGSCSGCYFYLLVQGQSTKALVSLSPHPNGKEPP